MKIYTKKLIFALAFCLSIITAKAQVYSEDFDSGSCNTSFPGNWTTASTTSDWIVDDNSTTCLGAVPECNIVGSSGGSVLGGADGSSGLETAVSASFSANGFTNLQVDWNGYRTTGAPALTFEYSFDDVTYTVVTISDVATDDAWHAISTVNLPAACDNQPVIYLRWSYTGTGAGAFIAFDDIVVNGTGLTIFYWNGGAPHLTTSWGANLDGTGVNPINFTTAGHIYNFYNNTGTSFAPTLSANWAVSGGSVFINVGDGNTRLTNFTIPAGFSLSVANSTLVTTNGSTLTLQNTTMPPASLVTLNTGSTIDFAQSSSVTLYNKVYTNLTISGGANKSQSGSTTINGILNLASATSNFVMTNSALLTLTLNGSITGAGSILTGNSRLTIGGTGAFGTITFGVGATSRTVNQFNINRTASGSVILGSNLTVNGNSSFTNGTLSLNGNTLTCNGALTFPVSSANGLFIGSSTSSFLIGGSGAINNSLLFDQTSAATRSMNDVFLNRSGATLTLGNALEVYGSITPSVGTIASGSNLTLKSSATSKARIGIISATGAFTGNPTVEVFKGAGATNWVNLCSGGVTGGHMSGWNTSFAITCQTCPDGWVVGSGNFTSIYTYDETAFVGDDANAAHYVEISGLTSLDSRTGYWVYIGNGFPNTTAITIPLTGSGVNTKSSVTYNLSLSGAPAATDGWNLISNPYPSPILVSQVIASAGASNVDNMLYVFDSNANTNVIYSASGSNSVIPMGQAFAIRALVNPVSFSPIETWKTPTNVNDGLLKTSASYTPNYFFDDFLIDLSSTTISTPFYSSAYFNFDPTATTNFDNGKDAFLIGNSVDPAQAVIYSTNSGKKYVRNSQPLLGSGTTIIPLVVRSGVNGTFKFTPKNLNKLPAGACVQLYDIANNTTHDLKTGPYTRTISANATIPQLELRITINPATLTSSQNDPTCLNGTNGAIIANGTSAGPWTYTWKDMSSNILKVSTNKPTADTLNNLAPGNYQVDVANSSACSNANATFTLVSSSPLPVSSFTVNNDTLGIFGPTQFVFTNNSSNANSYFWTFGDGNTSTLQNPSYMYTNAGAYNVTLHAINSVCGDTTTYNFNVYAVNNTGIATLASDNFIKVGQDVNGIYVQLNYDKNTKATVSVTNILGQELITPKLIEGATERFYINVNAKDQLLFITVTTGERRVTERVFSN